MAISANYTIPVYVNGYQCDNCAQVPEAKKDINPADPQAGPWGIDVKSSHDAGQSPAFVLDGSLANGSQATASPPQLASASGNLLDISA